MLQSFSFHLYSIQHYIGTELIVFAVYLHIQKKLAIIKMMGDKLKKEDKF